jgi:hypothetical protein
MNNEGTLSERYEYILRFSQVMQSELDEDTKAKIEKFRSLLTVKNKKKNLIDDTETEVEEPGPLVKVYHEKMKAYEDAVLEYNARRIDAMAGEDPKAIHFWTLNAAILRNKVKAAMDDWISSGHKNDYEAIAGFIDHVMQRDMTLLKIHYKEALDRARMTGIASGSDFYYSSLVPGNWVKSSGWTRFTFSSADFSQYQDSSFNKTAGAGGFRGFFGGQGAQAREETNLKINSKQFKLSFSITQASIVRKWLQMPFVISKGWRFDESNPEAKGQMVSDGGATPRGLIPAYPTSIICIKDLELSMAESTAFQEYVKKSTAGGGFLSFGAFSLGGTHSRGNTTRNVGYTFTNQGMKVEGMQIVGFKCHVVPKCPDPLDSITKWV